MAVRPSRPTGPFVSIVALAIVAGVASYDFFVADPPAEKPASVAEAPASTPMVRDDGPPPRAPPRRCPSTRATAWCGIASPRCRRTPGLAAWLIPDDLVRIFVVVVDNVADGHTPAEHLPPWRPTRRFQTAGASPRAPHRSAQPRPATTPTRRSWRPSIRGWRPSSITPCSRSSPPPTRSWGRAGDEFDATVLRALRNLLETPVLERDVRLIHRPPFFEFADPALEDLLPIQKQFLGMGPPQRAGGAGQPAGDRRGDRIRHHRPAGAPGHALTRSGRAPPPMRLLVKRLDPAGAHPPPRAQHPGDAGLDLFSAADIDVPAGETRLVGHRPRHRAAPRHRGPDTAAQRPRPAPRRHRAERARHHRRRLSRRSRRPPHQPRPADPFRVRRGMKVAQLVVTPVIEVEVVEAASLSDTARSGDGFGSTG